MLTIHHTPYTIHHRSSREHAPWSIDGMGIRCTISTSFADIFHSNCMKNGMLPVTLPKEQVTELMEDAKAHLQIEVDLQTQTVIREDGTRYSMHYRASYYIHHTNALEQVPV